MDPRRARSFGAAADDYDAARPSYPKEAVQWVLPDAARRVLDLGAGTGKLTRVLLDLGLEAVAVEPDDAMRARVPAESHAGTAEQIPLPDASVDVVVVGQAFHWFDAARAVPEMVRVLRPGGAIGLLWNLLDDSAAWVAALCEVTQQEARLSFVEQAGTPPFTGADFGLSQPEQRLFRHEQPMDRDLLARQLRSTSRFILLEPDEREALLAAALATAPDGSFPLPHVTDTWRATRR